MTNSLGRTVAPHGRDVLQLVEHLRIELVVPAQLGGVSGSRGTAHRLPNLPDPAALEGERRSVDDRFVAEVEGAEARAAEQGQEAAAGTEHRHPQAADLRERAGVAYEPGQRRVVADRVAGDQHHPRSPPGSRGTRCDRR
jgi:hypothetical protein